MMRGINHLDRNESCLIAGRTVLTAVLFEPIVDGVVRATDIAGDLGNERVRVENASDGFCANFGGVTKRDMKGWR
jgi:hypothetical protein